MTKTTDTTALQHAKTLWAAASAAQIEATKATQTARDDLARVQALIAQEQGRSDAAAQAGRNAVLAELGFAKKTDGPTASAAAIAQATAAQRLDALHAAHGMAEKTVTRVDSDLARCDAATRQAERAILSAKAALAIEVEAKAFAAFQEAHLHYLAVGAALQHRDMNMKTGPGYWTTRVYGDRYYIDHTTPGLTEACAELTALAEQGK